MKCLEMEFKVTEPPKMNSNLKSPCIMLYSKQQKKETQYDYILSLSM